jgi:predicted NBD/HSP70 family sugar kinase
MRDINRQIVLNYVRERGPISRAEIARATALQRSTVSAIIDALVLDGIIEEIGKGESTGGRCPTMLRLRAGNATAIGVDIQPKLTTVATSDIAGRLIYKREFATEPDFDTTINQVIKYVQELSHDCRDIEGIGVILPGLVDPMSGNLLYVPYFNWRNIEVQQRLAAAVGLPVRIDNDANAAALAELWFGRPEISEARDFILLWVSEGLGTGIIFDRQIYRGSGCAAGEFGHMIIGQNAPVTCSCGSFDCWEAFASGRAAVGRYTKLGASDTPTFAQLIDRALEGEIRAQTALLETAESLSVGISNLIVGLSPDLIVVAGPMARAWSLVQKVFYETAERSVRSGLPKARIVASTLGDRTTLMGAISLVLSRKFGSVALTELERI